MWCGPSGNVRNDDGYISNWRGWSLVACRQRAERRAGSSPLASSDFVLLDVEDAVGQIAAAADEVSFIQRLEASRSNGWTLCFLRVRLRRPGNIGRMRARRARALWI